ncbi:MAG: thioredoxin-dependent thiol peroxidase [Bdellovibrionaceae bacterium]|nr:thioredoxin-dependent thiol peroxidase [Pseudobdellovibrionaceae bacterium]|tara:strand:+ start:932 stop:1390 length:459 start_codon:yes stop_codon:yes gene_type:complete
MTALLEGKKAPAFTGVTDSGEKVSLKDFKGKTVVLYFYPKDMTPGCTTEACDFRDSMTRLKRKKVVVIGVSADSVARHEKFRDKHDLNFPLISDEDLKICKAYGVWQKKKLYGKEFMGIVRTTFIIDSEGKIKKIFPKVKVKGHVDEIIESL